MQHGAPSHSELPVRAWLGNYFPRRWIGRGEEENGRHERPIVPDVIFFFPGALEQSGSLPIEITNTSQTETSNCRYFRAVTFEIVSFESLSSGFTYGLQNGSRTVAMQHSV